MDALRSERVGVNLSPANLARVDRVAQRNRWPRAAAAAYLIERALDDIDERGLQREQARGSAA